MSTDSSNPFVVTDDKGNIDYPKTTDNFLSFGTGSYKGPDWSSTLMGNGYTHSMVPGAIAGAGLGALFSAIGGKNVFGGILTGAGVGAGLGALHQYFYDTDKEYAFNNPFTKFMESLTVPKNSDGTVNIYKLITGKEGLPGIPTLDYDSLRKKFQEGSGDPVKDWTTKAHTWNNNIPIISIPGDRLRPHHLYYPLFLLSQQANK